MVNSPLLKTIREYTCALNLKTNKQCSLGDWNAKVGSQEIITSRFGLGVQNEVKQRLTEFWQQNTWVIANIHFQQHKRQLYTWTSPDGVYRNQTDYIICSQRWRRSIQSAKTRPRTACGSNHELLMAKFRLKLKKLREDTRPLTYDLNQIPYNHTLVKGSDLIECLKNYGQRFMILYRRWWSKP